MIEVCSCITLYPVRACAPIAGPVGLTARGRQALLAGRYCHRHGALFLLVREKKYSREARLGDELREHRGDYASRRVLTCNKQVRSL